MDKTIIMIFKILSNFSIVSNKIIFFYNGNIIHGSNMKLLKNTSRGVQKKLPVPCMIAISFPCSLALDHPWH
jgi:ABC-type multidrug transport system ATPase subunit